MKVVKATRYGFRTVIVVCHNPDEPEYVHSDGSAHPSLNVNGCASGAGESHVCTSNHRFQEFVWDGAAQYDDDGILITPESLWAEICDKCVAPSDPEEMGSLIGLNY